MKKIKVGDILHFRKDLVVGEIYGGTKALRYMVKELSGKEFYVSEVFPAEVREPDSNILLDTDAGWLISYEMTEEYLNEHNVEVPDANPDEEPEPISCLFNRIKDMTVSEMAKMLVDHAAFQDRRGNIIFPILGGKDVVVSVEDRTKETDYRAAAYHAQEEALLGDEKKKPGRWTDEDILWARAAKASGATEVYRWKCEPYCTIIIPEKKLPGGLDDCVYLAYTQFESINEDEHVKLDDILSEVEL